MKNKWIYVCMIIVVLVGLEGVVHRRDVDRSGEKAVMSVGSMKGPTTLGLLPLMEKQKAGEAKGDYSFAMVTGADELLPMMIRGELDCALVPANVAAVLYQRMEGDLSVIDVNTLGVLYLVSGDERIQDMKDLQGRTVYLTGKGTSPDFVFQYLMQANGISPEDVKLEYKSEATEVAVLLADRPEAAGILPQPFATAACSQNPALSEVLDLTEQWEQVQGEAGSSLVTGVTVVRKSFLEEHPKAVKTFLEEHRESTSYMKEYVEEGAALAVASGIIAKEPLAVNALPKCNLVCLTGAEMKQALQGYLEVLYGFSAESVGGALPADEFYYEGQ